MMIEEDLFYGEECAMEESTEADDDEKAENQRILKTKKNCD